jgi:hypothetical protein
VLARALTLRSDSHETHEFSANEGGGGDQGDLIMKLLYFSGIFMVMKNEKKYAFHYHYSACSLSLLEEKRF